MSKVTREKRKNTLSENEQSPPAKVQYNGNEPDSHGTAQVVTPVKSTKYYVVHLEGNQSMRMNNVSEIENFKKAYPNVFRSFQAFDSADEADKYMKQIQNTKVKEDNNKADEEKTYKAYLKATQKTGGTNEYDIDLFYDQFAKNVVMRAVLLNTNGMLFWCHKPWQVAPAISNYPSFFGINDFLKDSTFSDSVGEALTNFHALAVRDINKGEDDVLTTGKKQIKGYALVTCFTKPNEYDISNEKKVLSDIATEIMSVVKQVMATKPFKQNLSENLSPQIWEAMKGWNSDYWGIIPQAPVTVHHNRPTTSFFLKKHQSYVEGLKLGTQRIYATQGYTEDAS